LHRHVRPREHDEHRASPEQRGRFLPATFAGLMLLDLKMPWMDGFDVLSWLRSRKQFDTLPVVVLTSSKLQSDIDRSRQLGVYDYRVKPQLLEDLVRLLDDVRKCWLDERFNRFCLLSGTPPPQPFRSAEQSPPPP
jgi:CheY-like chemotaxis protein